MGKECGHLWVKRLDGYEEQCIPAICLWCGKYGCFCDFNRSIKELPDAAKARAKDLFKTMGIDGDEHKLEDSL